MNEITNPTGSEQPGVQVSGTIEYSFPIPLLPRTDRLSAFSKMLFNQLFGAASDFQFDEATSPRICVSRPHKEEQIIVHTKEQPSVQACMITAKEQGGTVTVTLSFNTRWFTSRTIGMKRFEDALPQVVNSCLYAAAITAPKDPQTCRNGLAVIQGEKLVVRPETRRRARSGS